MEQINLSASRGAGMFEEQLEVNKVNQQFRQESKIRGVVREFSIFNNTHFYQLVKKKHLGKSEFNLNLALLDSKPKSEFTFSYNWLIASAICTLVSLLAIYISWFSTVQVNSTVASIVSTLSVTLCAIVFLTMLLKTEHQVRLFSHYGHAPIIEFIDNNPNKKALSKFIKILRQHIEYAQRNANLSVKESLSLELKELRRLHEETAISLEHYELAKKNIFDNRAFSA